MRSLLTLLAFLIAAPAWAVQFEEVTYGVARVTVVSVDPAKEQLRLFLDDEARTPFENFGRLASWLKSQQHTLMFAMNAGMYEPDLRPVGLFVADGIVKSPLNTANGTGNFFMKPNGVFYVTEAGPAIVESSQFAKLQRPVLLATQSGPLLVLAGRIHPAFNIASTSRLVRNGVGITPSGKVLFAISETPISFYEFARLFRDQLHCNNALYLDGVASSLYALELGRNDTKASLGPIIGVVR